jgi:hypothetical protein
VQQFAYHPHLYRLLSETRRPNVVACGRRSGNDPVLSVESGGAVFDPFAGSGTTLIAAEKSGRNARLIELDPKYVDVIVQRWEQFTGQQAIHAETGKLLEVTHP